MLAEHGVQIISGLAKGIDSCAHKGALEAGGDTFAVLGCGVDVCYPRQNQDLYRRAWYRKRGNFRIEKQELLPMRGIFQEETGL